ncbi:MAG TPA: hypothetical protein VMX54_03245 [Vicinamibacteria bacterium]|nr:hypothetical protein [Vicinamibacteria bacterium]
MANLKIRLDDGSEVGPMDVDMVQTWFQQGLLNRDSLVQRPGSPRWVRLSEAVDLSRWLAGQAAGGGRPRATGRLATPVVPEASPADAARWRQVVAAAVLGLLAAAAFVVALRPEAVRPELDDAPWLKIGLSSLALGLALVPRWAFCRRIVRLTCLLAAAAVFPLAGVFVARGIRAEALLALASAAVLATGLVLLLAPRLAALGAVAALLAVGAGAFGVARFARTEPGPALEVGTWALGERRILDPELGLDLTLPPGWVGLKPGNPLVPAASAARAALAQPRVGGYALLVSETAPAGVLSLEHYLDEVIARRRASATAVDEGWRRDGRLGALPSRRAALQRTSQDGRFAERIAVARDGDRYFALVTWVPEAAGGRALEEADALEAATTFSAVRSRSRSEAVRTAALELPFLSPQSIEQLVEAAGPAGPAALFRRATAASARGAAALGPAAAQELRALTAASAASLAYEQRAQLADYLHRVTAGQPTTAEEDERTRVLAKAATLRLSAPQRERLEQLHEQAIRAALAAGKSGS